MLVPGSLEVQPSPSQHPAPRITAEACGKGEDAAAPLEPGESEQTWRMFSESQDGLC